MSEQDEEEGGN